ncbi:MAG TPA: Type 1 glutamine amidotransferase-like domain-containing protein [Gaiellaceae bacterium]|nr:Type 1 glutamine amidotransferase-like domain-containing protein [Gaiellaceae bacterium]
MRLLLTSAGIKNATIHDALVELLGKPIGESSALCIPTGGYGSSYGSPAGIWRFISGRSAQPMCELGWKSLGVLELTALPSIGAERWLEWVREADVLLVNGGDALYLGHWLRESGLAALLPSLTETVYVGFSAGSMVLTPRIGEDFVGWKPPTGSDETLGVVDFSIFPHVDHPDLPENTMAEAERWAGGLANPAYAIDDETAIKVVGDAVEVVSEGHWRLFDSRSGTGA